MSEWGTDSLQERCRGMPNKTAEVEPSPMPDVACLLTCKWRNNADTRLENSRKERQDTCDDDSAMAHHT